MPIFSKFRFKRVRALSVIMAANFIKQVRIEEILKGWFGIIACEDQMVPK